MAGSGHRLLSPHIWESLWTESSSGRTWSGSRQTARCYRVKMEQKRLIESVAQTRHQGDVRWGKRPAEQRARWCHRDSEQNGLHWTAQCDAVQGAETRCSHGEKWDSIMIGWGNQHSFQCLTRTAYKTEILALTNVRRNRPTKLRNVPNIFFWLILKTLYASQVLKVMQFGSHTLVISKQTRASACSKQSRHSRKEDRPSGQPHSCINATQWI